MKANNSTLKKSALVIAMISLITGLGWMLSDPFQLIDLHVHIKGDLTIEKAIEKSKLDNIQYGIAVNCGIGFPVHSDKGIDSFLLVMKKYPQFYVGMQAEGREWVKIFSKEAISKFDYVFTDGMTFTDEKDRRNRIWIKDETWIDDEQQFMDYLVKTIVTILNNEPINIYVNPTFLPEQMAGRYDTFWTEKRMSAVIDAAVKNKKAIEINNRFKIPSEKFISLAKQKGAKFTIGTNNIDSNFGRAEYALEMIKKCGLTEKDFWKPVKKNSGNVMMMQK
jgi:histidinol phosphatase-like PHP family hydrolase